MQPRTCSTRSLRLPIWRRDRPARPFFSTASRTSRKVTAWMSGSLTATTTSSRRSRGGQLPVPTPARPTLGFPTLGFPTLEFPTLGFPTLGFPMLGFPTLGFPMLEFPTLEFPTLGFPTLALLMLALLMLAFPALPSRPPP